MLRNFRQVFKGQQKYMTLVMGIVVLSLVAYLAPGSNQPNAPDNVVARVYGREITYRALGLKMNEMMAQYGKQANSEMMRPFIQSQALNQLIYGKLMEVMAESRGLVATDGEVRDRMMDIFKNAPGFTNADGSLKTADEINDLLLENPTRPITLKLFEGEIRTMIVDQKMRADAANSVPVDEAWLNHEHRFRNEKMTLEVRTVAPDLATVADPGDAKLGEFMKAQGARFQVGPRRVISYVALDQAALAKTIEPDEAALKATYLSKQAEYTEYRTAHILLTGANDGELANAAKVLQDVRAKVLAGADFGKLADEMTQDPSGKGKGGELGFAKHRQFDKPFEDAALALKVGELSQPVKSRFGMHLIKLLERKDKRFEDVREELRTQLMSERFTTKAKEKLEQLRKTTGDKGDLGRAAKAQSLVVKTSKPFLDEPSAQIEGLNGAGMLVGEAFRMKVGQVSKVQKVGDSYVVFRVQEEKPSAIPGLADIRAKVLEAFKLEEARKALLAKAQAALASGDLASLGAATTQADKTLKDLGEAGQHPGIVKALLATPEGKATPLFWTQDGQLWVAEVKARTAAAPMNFEQRQTLVKELQQAQSMKILNAELSDLYSKGKLRPGLSSLWGYVGGIWTNDEILKLMSSDAGGE